MTRPIAVSKEEVLREIEDLKKLIDEKEAILNELSKTPMDWEPEEFDKYFYADLKGEIIEDIHLAETQKPIIAKATRIFRTAQEAEEYAAKRETMKRLECYSYRPTSLSELIWVITCSDDGKIEYRQYPYGYVGGICFHTLEAANDAVDSVISRIGEVRFLNHYFELDGDFI